MLTVEIAPSDIQHKDFARAKRGFDPDEVGAYLEDVAAALAARDRDLHEARTEIEALNRVVVDAKQNEEAFRLTMMAATEAKEEMLARAAAEAERIEDEARAAAAVIIERARADAEDEVARVRRDLGGLRDAAAVAANGSNPASEADEIDGGSRPALELVVDRQGPQDTDGDEGLAARVGELRA